ncbi:MAG: DUF2452 domain-containing protein [Gammaproteobacteria bacterium]
MTKETKHNLPAVAPKTAGNPDGKGVSTTLSDWFGVEPRGVAAKPKHQVLAEFFTSMLVLNARFSYKPVIGATNYLYYVDDSWRMSLIAPDEWTEQHRDGFAGACELQRDMTWTIEPAENLLKPGAMADAVTTFFDVFAQSLDTDLTLEEILPFYVHRMPYWQRLHASGLSRSIRAAVILGDQTAIKARDWRLALPASNELLRLESN